MQLKQPNETFAEYFDHKPSRALQAMCDGLDAALRRDDFDVNMNTFGRVSVICYGCAATCTVLQAEGWKDGLDLQARVISLGGPDPKVNHVDTWVFEQAIDSARYGILSRLAEYMGVLLPVELEPKWKVSYEGQYPMERRNILETIKELAAIGL